MSYHTIGSLYCENENYAGRDVDGNIVRAHDACCACGGRGPALGHQAAGSTESSLAGADLVAPLGAGTYRVIVLVVLAAIRRRRRSVHTHTRLPNDATSEATHKQGDDDDGERATLIASV